MLLYEGLAKQRSLVMDIGKTKITCGSIWFARQYRDLDGGAPHTQGAGGRGDSDADQGVCLQVVGHVGESARETAGDDRARWLSHYRRSPRHGADRGQVSSSRS